MRVFAFFLPVFHAWAMFVGNIADPAIQKKGLFIDPPQSYSFRIGYLGDYVYRQNIHDEVTLNACEEDLSHMQLWTQAGVGTFSFRNRFDVYGILGATRLQIDPGDILTSQQFAWGVGGKIVILHAKRFRVGVDLKYFQSTQNPSFFGCDGLAYNITSAFSFAYTETQGAAGVSYHTRYVSPYAAASYIIAKIVPEPQSGAYVKLPDDVDEVLVEIKSMTVSSRFGLVLGASLIDQEKASLNVEWRAFNQNAVSLLGEIRF